MHVSNHHALPLELLNNSTSIAFGEKRALKGCLLLSLALACTGLLSLNLADPDLWGHIRYAEDWLATGELPTHATHSYTAENHAWINHELLAELMLAIGYRLLDIQGLLVAKSLLGLALVGLMIKAAARRGVPVLAAWTMMVLVCANLHPFFLLRPQLFSFALFGLMLVIFERAFSNWQVDQSLNRQSLWLLLPLFAVWTNTHGAFVAGLGITVVMLGGRICEKLYRNRSFDKDCWHLGIVIFGCGLVTLLNPYGVSLHLWLWNSLSQPRPEITEWMAPSSSNVVFWPWLALLTIGSLSLVFCKQQRDWVKIGILAVVAWQSALHMRHIALLALLAGFWLPEYVVAAYQRLPARKPKLQRLTNSAFLIRTATVGILLAIVWQSFWIDRQVRHMPVSRNRYPLNAVQFMADRGLQGNLVVSFNWAQYVVAALSPDVKVSLDGRFRTCYPQEVIDMNFDFLLGDFNGRRHRDSRSNSIDPTRVLNYGSPDLVLIDRRYNHATETIQAESTQWSLLYRDRVAEIWGRHQRYNKATSPYFFPLTLRVQDPGSRAGSVPWPALPMRETKEQIARQAARPAPVGDNS